MIISGKQEPSPQTLTGIAKAFEMSPEQIFRAAGLLPSLPPSTERTQEAAHLFAQLDEPAQEIVLTQLRALVQEHRRGQR